MALYPHETEMAYLDDGNKWLCHGQAIKPEDATNLDVWGEKSNMTGFEFKTAPVLFFDEDADEWIGLAGRVPDDIDDIVRSHPKEMPELMRAAKGLTPEQFARLQQTIARMKSKEK